MANLMEKVLSKTKFRQIMPLLVLTCSMVLFSFKHPYHVAITTVTYLKASKQLNIEVKAFYEDMEDAINKLDSTDIDIKNHPNIEERNEKVYSYMLQHFGISMTDGPVIVNKESITFKDEYIFIRYKGVDVEKGELVFYNTILYELEKTQTHIFNFKSGNIKQTKKVVNPNAEVHFNLQ